MNEFLQQLRTFYEGLEPARRRVLWAAVVAAVLIVAGVGVWASQTPYVTLTRAGTTDEVTAVTRALAVANVPYRLGTDGLTISVPAAVELDARRAASTEDGIVGLEGLEQIDPWVSPFQEQLHRQRMLQGELVRTINSIRGVAASTVQLNLPDRAAFLRDDARSTASVTVRPDAGSNIDRQTARAIAELVSHAVTGMSPEDVTVVDASNGRLLWSAAQEADETGGGDIAVQAARREAALSEGVRAALARLLGSTDAAAVTVHVELETSATQSTVSEIDPESASPQKERIESEENGTTMAPPQGIPGTDSNLPERALTGSQGVSGGGRKRDASETTYQYSSSQTTTVRPAGDVRRVSASVLVDTAALDAVLGAEATEEQRTKLRADLEAAVKAALGHSATRGDSVVVSFLPFAPAPLSEVETTASVSVVEQWTPAGIAALAVLLAFLFVVRPLLRAVRPPAQSSTAVGVGGEAANSPILASADDDAAGEDGLDDRLRRQAEGFQALSAAHVSNLVRRESENSAEVLRRWLRSQGGAS